MFLFSSPKTKKISEDKPALTHLGTQNNFSMYNVVTKDWSWKMKEEKKKRKHGLEKWSNSVLGIFWFAKTEPVESESEEDDADLGDTGEDVFHPQRVHAGNDKKIFMERRCLPDNFAEEVMDNEFAIEEGNFGMENIDRLIYLYSQAMEFYEAEDHDKYVRFKDRI